MEKELELKIHIMFKCSNNQNNNPFKDKFNKNLQIELNSSFALICNISLE